MPCNPNIHHRRSVRLKDYDDSVSRKLFNTFSISPRVAPRRVVGKN
ncbi:MAG: hypothetical protein LBK58_13430 [Prevotellaceae bacterium]|nr:hypothetical protein [Prevotellaceae bacterium]